MLERNKINCPHCLMTWRYDRRPGREDSVKQIGTEYYDRNKQVFSFGSVYFLLTGSWMFQRGPNEPIGYGGSPRAT